MIPEGTYLFLKFVGYVAGTGLVASTLIDQKDNTFLKLIGRRMKGVFGMKNVKKVKRFPFVEGHTIVIGTTQMGKTFATMQSLIYVKEGVFFFNAQQVATPNGFIKMNSTYPISQMIKMIKQGKKINYIPSSDVDRMSKELEKITNAFYDYGEINMRYVIDEVHLFGMLTQKKEGLKACKRVATTGIRFGYKGVFISQRAALIDNTIYTQSIQNIIFTIGKNDYSYMKTNGFPVEEFESKTNNEPYKFVIYDNREVKGAYIIAD